MQPFWLDLVWGLWVPWFDPCWGGCVPQDKELVAGAVEWEWGNKDKEECWGREGNQEVGRGWVAAGWGMSGVPLAPVLADDQVGLWRNIWIGLLGGPCPLHRSRGRSEGVV